MLSGPRESLALRAPGHFTNCPISGFLKPRQATGGHSLGQFSQASSCPQESVPCLMRMSKKDRMGQCAVWGRMRSSTELLPLPSTSNWLNMGCAQWVLESTVKVGLTVSRTQDWCCPSSHAVTWPWAGHTCVTYMCCGLYLECCPPPCLFTPFPLPTFSSSAPSPGSLPRIP